MKPPTNHESEKFRVSGPPCTNSGAFLVKRGSFRLRCIASDGMGWDHVSISLQNRCPTWDEMNHIKDLFFKPEETVMQLHPGRSAYINNHPYCLHLWRPQTKEEIEEVKKQWGEAWIYGDIEAYGSIPLPPLEFV